MVFCKSIASVREIEQKFFVLIGSFDGIHRGHQYLIRWAKHVASAQQAALCVVSFSPHPQLLFAQKSNFLLQNDEQKRDVLSQLEVDYHLVINFTKECAALSPEEFLFTFFSSEKWQGLLIGYDFALGKNRAGSASVLQNYMLQKKKQFYQFRPIYFNKEPFSSTLVRQMLWRGDISMVTKLLGRPFSYQGQWQAGKQLGRRLGVPTINVYPPAHFALPPAGVYITEILIDNKRYKSVSNVGVNPTTDDSSDIKIETHLLTEKNIHKSASVEIFFLAFLRREKKFTSLDRLKQQICRDIQQAEEWHGL